VIRLVLLFVLGILSNRAIAFDRVNYGEADRAIKIFCGDRVVGLCQLENYLNDVRPIFNWDQSVIVLTSVDFVAVQEVLACSRGSVRALRIPDRVGFVVDVNLKKNIYLSLGPIYTPPLRFVAVVAKLGSRIPLGVYPGMYSARKTVRQMQREGGLVFFEDRPGRISPDGRYVSADGGMRCGDSEFPGVWDLKTKKLVKDRTDCAPLFGLPAR